MSLSKNAIVFSVNGTQQNKRIKNASLLVLKAEYAYCIQFILLGKCVKFIRIDKGFHYLSGCFIVLNNQLFIKAVLTHLDCACNIWFAEHTTVEKHHECQHIAI